MPTPLECMRIVARRLQAIEVRFVFVGGAVVGVLVDHPELTEVRPTKDVDVIVELFTYGDYDSLREKLRAEGFREDDAPGAPICRWRIENCLLDIMPTDEAGVGPSSRWFSDAFLNARAADLGEGVRAQIIAPAYFLATKLDAFKDRGEGDYFGSHDLEDMVALVDGAASIVREVQDSPPDVKTSISREFRALLNQPDFQDAFPGHLPVISRPRAQMVWERFQAIAELAPV